MQTPDPNVQRELTLLAGLLVNPDRLDEVVDVLRESDFTVADHRHLWSALIAVHTRRQPIDYVTVHEELVAANGNVKHWADFLARVTMEATSSVHVPHHARAIADLSTIREISKACGECAVEAKSVVPGVQEAVEDFVDRVEAKVFAAAHRRLEGARVTAPRPIVQEVLAAIANREVVGVQTGISELDDVLLGMRPGELFVIAARPGLGKTALGMQIALNVASMGGNIFYAGIEMTNHELVERAIANISGVDSYRIRKRQLTLEDHQALMSAGESMANLQFGMTDDPGMTVPRLRSLARRWVLQSGGLDLMVVDYLQLMKDPTARGGDRVQEITNISRGLKELAKELRVPLIALSQLSRAGDIERPKLSHLRDSGSIEQDADQVALLYMPKSGDNRTRMCGIDKNRHGRTDEVELGFDGATYRFSGTRPWTPGPEHTTPTPRVETFDFDDQGQDRSRRDWDD